MNSKEALAWIADVFEEEPEELTPETPRGDIPGWDSMGILALMAGLDRDFDILLTADDMQSMTKVDDILQILNRNGKIGQG
ncbi:MAG: hypothetical protein ACC669_10850 [bacterium]